MSYERPEGYGLECPWCHRWVTPQDIAEQCPNSMLMNGLHPIVCFDARNNPWEREHTQDSVTGEHLIKYSQQRGKG